MGLFEILPHLPRLLRIRRKLLARVLAQRPDVYVGVDAKEFNLRVAPRLKAHGIRTVQYVSPQIWAWRRGRVRTIGRAVDLVLCLLPFEKRFYDEHGVHAVFVGHLPLADQIPMHLDPREARTARARPGGYLRRAAARLDRHGEVARLRSRLRRHRRVAPAAAPGTEVPRCARQRRRTPDACSSAPAAGVRDRVTLVDGNAQRVMAASDVVLLASGTATLEATLVKPDGGRLPLESADNFSA